MKNINNVHDCYGCGVCAMVCNHSAIEMTYNQYGFIEPIIKDNDKCIGCGMCQKVCSFMHKDKVLDSKPQYCYGGWSKDKEIVSSCASGGVGYEIAKWAIENGYNVCSCRYDAENDRPEHYISTTVNELKSSRNSKYLQSWTFDAFKKINKNDRYLVVGTPCQIDSFRRYLRMFNKEENFILVDFFCHGVPTMLAWKEYQRIYCKNIGKIRNVTWRNKLKGWHLSYALTIDGAKGRLESYSQDGDMFFKLFIWDFCANPACHDDCKFKYDASSADIRLGDFWGDTYRKNDKGVTSVVTFTDKGHDIICGLKNVVLEQYNFDEIAKLQLRTNAKKAMLSNIAWKMLLSHKTYSASLWNILFMFESMARFPNRVRRKAINMFFKKEIL